MNLLIDTNNIQEALRVILKLAAPVQGTVTIQSDGKKAYMHSVSEVNRCTYQLPCKVSGKASVFAIGVESLRDATKGRKEISMVYDKTVLTVKSGSYAAKLATSDALQLEYEDEKKAKPIKLTAEQAVWLKGAVSTVSLKPTAILTTVMPVSVKMTAKGTFLSCYDTDHMAYLFSKEIKGETDVTLPLDTLQAILDTFNNSAFRMELSASNLYVSNPLVTAVLALPQAEENVITGEDVRAKAKEASEMKGRTVGVSKKDVLEFLDNARSVTAKERGEIHITVEKGKLRLQVTTVNGSVKTIIKATTSKELKVRVDAQFFEEAIRKSDEEINMKVVGSDFIMFQQQSSTVLVALNHEKASEE